MDKDENGSLDMEEFKVRRQITRLSVTTHPDANEHSQEGSKRDETIVSALSLYDGLV
jgi:hypothetical protein